MPPDPTNNPLLLKPVSFDEIAERDAMAIPFDNPHAHADYIRRAVESGDAECFGVVCGGHRIGTVFCSVAQGFLRELVIIGAHCSSDVPLSAMLAVCIVDLAKTRQCVSARFHTLRPGLVKQSLALGWRVSEIVMRIDVTPT